MADATYIPKVYHKQGGDDLIIASGGTETVESGGTIAVESGGKITVAAGGLVEYASGTVTLVSDAGTLSKLSGVITTEASTLAAGSAVTYTITNTLVAATDIILLTRLGGTSDEGTEIMLATPGAGSFTILVENRHASAAFDGTFIIGFLVVQVAV